VTSGMEFLSLSAGNITSGTDLEDNTVKHVYLDAASNVFHGLHMESAPIGYDITANGRNYVRIGTTFASTVTVFENNPTNAVGTVLDATLVDTWKLGLGALGITSKTSLSTTTVNIDPVPPDGATSGIVNVFRNVTTTGVKQINVYKGDGTTTLMAQIDVTTGNLLAAGNFSLGGYGTIAYGAAVPTTGFWPKASLMLHRLPALGSPTGWVCTVAGTPGTWAPLPTLIAKVATATLVAGTVTVADAAITANSIIRLSSKTLGGTPGALFVSAKTAATNFTITSTNAADTSVVQYEIIAY
jgi:hypothetical protein